MVDYVQVVEVYYISVIRFLLVGRVDKDYLHMD